MINDILQILVPVFWKIILFVLVPLVLVVGAWEQWTKRRRVQSNPTPPPAHKCSVYSPTEAHHCDCHGAHHPDDCLHLLCRCGKEVHVEGGIPTPLGMRIGVGMFKVECTTCQIAAYGFVKSKVVENWKRIGLRAPADKSKTTCSRCEIGSGENGV